METLSNKRQEGGHKQDLTNKRRRCSDSTPAAAGPRWLILISCIDGNGGNSSIADPKTTAASCTSSGKPFTISLGIASPPSCCSFHCDWHVGSTAGNSHGKQSKSVPVDVCIIAGHDDALLIQITATTTFGDHFLYEAGGGARPPSLSLLPGFHVPVQLGYKKHREPAPRFRYLRVENTGILRRGEDGDLVVCQFEMTHDPPVYDMADLCMLRVGRDSEWIVRRLPIVEHREGSSKLQPWRRRQSLVPGAAVPVGNRFLCWVQYSNGFIVCDMADEENPKLRYVPLPATSLQHDGYSYHWPCHPQAYFTLGAAGPDAVRFVSVSPPRCCLDYDEPGMTSCQGSSSSFSVTTWTMTLSTEEATMWVKDVVLDCDEIWKWRLPNYGCLPRDKHLEYPMVSSDDPDVIYFKVEAMAVEINTRSKKLLSVVPSSSTSRDLDEDDEFHIITAKLNW